MLTLITIPQTNDYYTIASRHDTIVHVTYGNGTMVWAWDISRDIVGR